jgi:hypothetical protein
MHSYLTPLRTSPTARSVSRRMLLLSHSLSFTSGTVSTLGRLSRLKFTDRFAFHPCFNHQSPCFHLPHSSFFLLVRMDQPRLCLFALLTWAVFLPRISVLLCSTPRPLPGFFKDPKCSLTMCLHHWRTLLHSDRMLRASHLGKTQLREGADVAILKTESIAEPSFLLSLTRSIDLSTNTMKRPHRILLMRFGH